MALQHRDRRPFEIRSALPRDYQALVPLWRELDLLHARLQPGFFRVAPGPGHTRPEHLLLRALSSPDEAMLVAEADPSVLAQAAGEPAIVGMVHVRVFCTPAQPAMVPLRRAHVEDLVVAPPARRLGCGRALMERALRWARERDAAQVVLTVWAGNADAEAFYRRLGFHVVSTVLGLDL